MPALLDTLKAVLFGIVEGITEWLPVSSTGHLILLNEFVKMDVSAEYMEMFDVVIQLGAILAVVVVFFKQLWPFDLRRRKGKNFGNGREARRLFQTAREELALRTLNTPDAEYVLSAADLRAAAQRLLNQEADIKTTAIGFHG